MQRCVLSGVPCLTPNSAANTYYWGSVSLWCGSWFMLERKPPPASGTELSCATAWARRLQVLTIAGACPAICLMFCLKTAQLWCQALEGMAAGVCCCFGMGLLCVLGEGAACAACISGHHCVLEHVYGVLLPPCNALPCVEPACALVKYECVWAATCIRL
jgi:hypothetical protein